MKKYKADYSKKYSFIDFLATRIGEKWIALSKIEKELDLTYEEDADILLYTDYSGVIYYGKEKTLYRPNYNFNLSLIWYPVSEVKEEPKNSILDQFDYKKETGEWIKRQPTNPKKEHDILRQEEIRSICRDEIKKQSNILSGEFVGFDKNILQFSDGTRYQFNKELWDKQIDEWSLIKGYKDIKKNAEKYIKKPKQAFDGDKKIWISNCLEYLHLSNNYPPLAGDYHVATQNEINQFFKGSKKRLKISEKYDKLSKCIFYKKKGVKYFHNLMDGKFYSYDKDHYFKYIAESEYLDALK